MSLDLTSLSTDEQRALYDKLAYQFRGVDADMSGPAAYMLDAVREVLHNTKPTARFIETFGRTRFRECVDVFEETLQAAVAPHLRRNVRQAVRVTMVKCIVTQLEARNIPVSLPTVVGAMMQTRHAVEQQFPGYIDAELLHVVVTGIKAAA